MAEQKKPRDISDLKARLGRTMTPKSSTSGSHEAAPGVMPPSPLGSAPAVVPPRAGNPGAIPPPSVVAAPGKTPSVAPPAFLQNIIGGGGHTAPAAARRNDDPFAAATPAAGPREVRLVIDEKPVDDAEVGRVARGRTGILLGLGLVLGVIFGFAVSSMAGENRLYNLSVRDGKEILKKVQTASATIDEADRLLDKLIQSASGKGGNPPAVDYATVEQLSRLAKPFTAEAFSRKFYAKFNAPTVDALFEYSSNIGNLWTKFTTLGAHTLPPARRTLLDQAATAAGQMATSQTGCVPVKTEGRYFCALVYVQKPTAESGDPPTTVMVSSKAGSPQTAEKSVYAGEALGDDSQNFVIITDTRQSVGVLGVQASAFAEYQRDLVELKGLLSRTVEIQGALIQQLGEIAKLSERFTF